MSRLVLDASALGEYLLGTSHGEVVAAALLDADADPHVPALCDVEVVAVLRRLLNAQRVSESRASDAVIDLIDLPLTRHGHLALLGRILRLRANFSAYDATYVALAEYLDATLVTADGPLARAVREHLELTVLDASGSAT